MGILGFVRSALDAGVAFEQGRGHEVLAGILEKAGFAVGAADSFTEEHPAEAFAAFLAGVAAVTLLGPEVAVAAEALAGTALMEAAEGAIADYLVSQLGFDAAAAGSVAAQSIAGASSVVVDNLVQTAGELSLRVVYANQASALASFGASQTADGGASAYAIGQGLANTPAGLLTDTSFTLGTMSRVLAEGSREVTAYSRDGNGSVSTSFPKGSDQPDRKTINYRDGTSERIIFGATGPASDNTYSGPDGTGAIIATTTFRPDGSKVITAALAPPAAAISSLQRTGQDVTVRGNGFVGSGAQPVSWIGTAGETELGFYWSEYYGTLAGQIAALGASIYHYQGALQGSSAFTNNSLLALGAPDEVAGLSITTAGPQYPLPETISYVFSSAVSAGTSFFLIDPGAYLKRTDYLGNSYTSNGPSSYKFSATLEGIPVDTSHWLFSVQSPFNGASNQTVIDRASGTVSVPYASEESLFPSTVVIVTPNTPIDTISVTANTIAGDFWGLSFPFTSTKTVIGDGAVFEATGAVAADQMISFGANSRLQIDAPATFKGKIANLAPGSVINLRGIPNAGAPATLVANQTGLTITYTSNSQPRTLVLPLLPQLTTTNLKLSASGDGAGGTAITVSAIDPLFDGTAFVAANPDVVGAGFDPYQQFMATGWKEGRNPSGWFDTKYYLDQNPDVKAAGVNPLTHFEQFGWKEGRDPSAAFSLSKYLDGNPDVRAAGTNPLLQFVQTGAAEGRVAYPVAPASQNYSFTDVTANGAGHAAGAAYAGPVSYLQNQYLWQGSDSVAISAAIPNVFLHGGAGGDALQVRGGSNVLDGGGGSNFLIGGAGGDKGIDTFFVDARGGVETWSTIVNFHVGDQATIFGFHDGVSTHPYTEMDGAAGYQGVTIHSEIDGQGTGIKASMTFAGISQATASAHFVLTTGTLAGGPDYLLIQYQ